MKKTIKKILPNHLAIYVRVSTEKQAMVGVSADNQLDKGIEKAKELGWSYTVYDDRGLSGSKSYFERPGIKKLISDLENNKIGGLYSFDIDRWSRDPTYVEPQILITKFIDSGIKIFTNNGELDLTNSGVAMTVRLKGFFASFERLQTKERVITALEKSMKNGNNAGGGQLVLYGYDRVNKKLVINTEEAEIVKKIYQYYLAGDGTPVIASKLNEEGIPTKRNTVANGKMTIKRSVTNKKTGEKEIIDIVKKGSEFVWRDTVIYNILKNTTYIGKKKWKNITVDTPIIIDENDFHAVQNLLKNKMKFKREPYSNVGKIVNHFLLKGLIRCGTCGSSYYGHKRADLKDKAYKCLSNRYKKGWCGNRGIDISFLDNLVWNYLLDFEKNLANLLKLNMKAGVFKALQAQIQSAEEKIEEINKYINSLNRKFIEEKVTEKVYNDLKMEYENEIEKHQDTITYTKNENYLMVNKDALLDIVKSLSFQMKSVKTIEEKQGFLRAFIDHITIQTRWTDNKQEVEIRYKFDQFSQLYVKDEINIDYKKNWVRIGSQSNGVKFWIKQEAEEGGKVWNSFHGAVNQDNEKVFDDGSAILVSEGKMKKQSSKKSKTNKANSLREHDETIDENGNLCDAEGNIIYYGRTGKNGIRYDYQGEEWLPL